ncbi:protein translocase subunit SecF [Paenibacillus macerans]|uniref:Protein-export membrane protein SecF n=1 Tax=Paenibacillus macerans TaxID=44252 RepID=A0A090ZL25_PAEMA|nr:protein translocase subunit SecF [Paenibacillus macerans]KFN11337.1 export membrane protein SecF [Paenibacillus macerans]MCY7558876.1 protein translocase subunit SecF [Paenibacillus macerans]MEC0150161.1 protein translocase subunit SecF [Paenibacillus macerans]MEC0332899.1 protein translocase subunit SecF [Paenibacillus macerans]SUD26696.1 protein-export membrane protein secF [Paenibacillus macerans]
MRFNKNLDYVHLSKYFYILSIVLTITGLICLSVFGLNYSVDFKAGSNVDISLTKPLTAEQVKPILDKLGIAEGTTVSLGEDRMNIRFTQVLSEDNDAQLKSEISKLDDKASFEVNTVDPEMARELARNAIYAVLISCIGIIIYVSIRFEWRFALAAIVALLHDAFMVIAVFSIFRLEVDLTFIVAVLTIIGYSINDTIVIFDRIRENLRFSKLKTRQDLVDLVNHSVAQTIMRSLYTALTVFVAAFFLFLLGGESIKMFSLAMVIGLLFGAYSSIFIASPLWFVFKGKQKNKPAKAS